MIISIEEARELKFLGIGVESTVCGNCRHFYRHYMKSGLPIFVGHCCYPRLKSRNVSDSCERFERKDEDTAS